MSQYYDVQSVEKNGVRVQRVGNIMPVYRNRLVAVLDRLMFKLAVDVTDEGEYQYFYKDYYSGAAVSFNLYDYDPNKV
jgi:hypothetical protein